MSKLLESELYKINYSDSLQPLIDKIIEILDQKIIEYKELFKVKDKNKVIINYFDNLDEFRNFIYGLRGEKESLPVYAKGTYDNGMVNGFIDKNDQIKRIYMANHELFHIYYMKYILNDDYSKRIVWYDEGMAQFMSGEMNKYEDINEFKNYFLEVKKNTKIIPDMNDLHHGESFKNDNYNGYDLSYLAIKYLYDTHKYEDFISLMSDFSKIKEYGKDIINKSFEYYDSKLK